MKGEYIAYDDNAKSYGSIIAIFHIGEFVVMLRRPFMPFLSLITVLGYAQQTYNLEIVFKKTHEPTVWYEGFGQALSSAGDVNNDGFDDVLIGSPSGEVRGRCFLYYGGNPMDTLVDMTFYGDTAGDGFAVSVCSGFLNDDSISDIVVGLCNGWVNGTQPGKVYVYFGGSGLDTIPDKVFVGMNNTEAFGNSITCGDINGDGYEDLVVGATYYPNTFVINGRVYVYYGGPLLDTIPDVIINGHNSESMGITVSSGGDVNSDGFEDIVAGAFNNDEAGFWAGKIYVFLGGNPMDTVPDCWLHGEGGGHMLGRFNLDVVEEDMTFDRILTGTPLYPLGFPNFAPGRLYVLFGGLSPDTIPDWIKTGETDSSSLGEWLSSCGYVNGGGSEEILAGASTENQFDGRGILWLGDSPLDTLLDAYLRGNINYYLIGFRVVGVGDVNNDGYDEVMFSNYAADSNQTVWVCRYTGEGIEETRRGGTGRQGIEIYPSPFSGVLYIAHGVGYKVKKIRIYDVGGREVVFYESEQEEVESTKGKEKMMQIDARDLPSGVYFVEVRQDNESAVKKVIKIK